MGLPSLAGTDCLHIVVFGPGKGEAIVLFAPPSTWVVVDSVRLRGTNPVIDLLQEHAASWSALVLTHPHVDHCDGFSEYLRFPGDGPVGCLIPPALASDERQMSREALLGGKRARKTQRQVLAAWAAHQAWRWNFGEGLSARTVGPLELLPLWPQTYQGSGDLNAISTPLLVRWKERTLLLAADLLHGQWASLATHPAVAQFAAGDPLKVAHHASKGAQHPIVIGGARERTTVCTPFSGSALPRFDDGHGVAALLSYAEQVLMTSFRYAESKTAITRGEAWSLQRSASGQRRGRYATSDLRGPVNPHDAWQHITIDTNGIRTSAGSEAITITN